MVAHLADAADADVEPLAHAHGGVALAADADLGLGCHQFAGVDVARARDAHVQAVGAAGQIEAAAAADRGRQLVAVNAGEPHVGRA